MLLVVNFSSYRLNRRTLFNWMLKKKHSKLGKNLSLGVCSNRLNVLQATHSCLEASSKNSLSSEVFDLLRSCWQFSPLTPLHFLVNQTGEFGVISRQYPKADKLVCSPNLSAGWITGRARRSYMLISSRSLKQGTTYF